MLDIHCIREILVFFEGKEKSLVYGNSFDELIKELPSYKKDTITFNFFKCISLKLIYNILDREDNLYSISEYGSEFKKYMDKCSEEEVVDEILLYYVIFNKSINLSY